MLRSRRPIDRHSTLELELADLVRAPWRRLLLRIHAATCSGCRLHLRRLRLVVRLLHAAARGDTIRTRESDEVQTR